MNMCMLNKDNNVLTVRLNSKTMFCFNITNGH